MKELLNTGVNLPLEYDSGTDTLIGKIKDYSVAIKENLETGSYGCLFWVKEGDFKAITDVEEFLTDRQKAEPEYIKKFRVTELGAAVALNRTNDDFANINNLKRFLFDFASNLSLNFYKNCCCECGKTEGLALYTAEGGVIAQFCKACCTGYTLLLGIDNDEEPLNSALPSFASAAEPLKEVIPEPAAQISSFGFGEIKSEAEKNVIKEASSAAEEAPAASDEDLNKEFAELMAAEEPVDTEVVKLEAPMEKENDSEDVLSEFILTEIEQKASEAEENVIAEPMVRSEENNNESIDALLFTGETPKEPERPKSKLFEEAEREFAEEQARLAAEAEKNPPENLLTDLLISENGEIAIKETEPEVDDGSADVTEFRDDSNDGEDFDVEEIESTVIQATVTTGHPQLAAEETPLEKDGSVPLINPNSHREERHVSPVNGPDAVQPLEFAQPITNEVLGDTAEKSELPPGYAGGDNMDRTPEPFKTSRPYNRAYEAADRYQSMRTIRYAERSNAFMGVIGTLVFGFIAILIWTLAAGTTEVAAYWGSLVVVAAAFCGYRVAGRSLDKKGIVISFVMSLIFAILGVIVLSTVGTQIMLSETLFVEASLVESFEWFIGTLGTTADISAIATDFAVPFIIVLVADIVVSIAAWRKA